MSVHIIIVNYKTASMVGDCLRSLAPDLPLLNRPVLEIVDAASPDDSPAQLQQTLDALALPARVHLTLLNENRGFAAANNAAIRHTLDKPDAPDFYLLLNPDTIVLPGAIPELVAHLMGEPETGIAGPRIENPDATARQTLFRFHNMATELHRAARWGWLSRRVPHWQSAYDPPETPFTPDWVSGACMLVRRQVFERIGLLDERFFMYYEEQDLARRAAHAGWHVRYFPEPRVIHLAGQSSGIQRNAPPTKPLPDYWFASRQHYLRKHHGTALALTTNALTLTLTAARQTLQVLARRPAQEPPGYLRGLLRHTLGV